MDRSRRLYDLWNWLVPFRVVAETESLPAATELLRIAPSALSRSVRLLEERLEVALFERRSHRLVLNEAGQRLLAAVRTGMRVIDDGVVDVIGDASARTIRIASPGELLPLVFASLGGLTDALAPAIAAVDEPVDDVLAGLRRGLVDLAIVVSSTGGDALVLRRLGALSRGVFIAAGAPAPATLRYAVPVDRDGAPRDGFPAGVSRTVGLRVRQGAAVLEAVRSGGLAAVLPHAVGRRAGFAEVDAGVDLAPLEISLATRSVVEPRDLAERVANQILEGWSRACAPA